jgi:hypothetical protein
MNKNKAIESIGNTGTRNKKDHMLTMHPSGSTTSSKIMSEKSFLRNTNYSNVSKIVATTKENKEIKEKEKEKDSKDSKNINKSSINPSILIALETNSIIKQNSKDFIKLNKQEKIISTTKPKPLNSNSFHNPTNTNISKQLNKENSNKKISVFNKKADINIGNSNNFEYSSIGQNQNSLVKINSVCKNVSNQNTKNNSNTNTSPNFNINSHQNSISFPDKHQFNQMLLLDKLGDCLTSYEKKELLEFNQDIYYIGLLNRRLTSYNSKDSNLENMNIKEKEKLAENNSNQAEGENQRKKTNLGSNDSIVLNKTDENNNGYDDSNGNYIVQIGDHINFRYEIISEVGRGSFGQVKTFKTKN